MTKLSDTQAIVLSAAARRPDGNVLPLPGSLRGGAATKVVAALPARGVIREQALDSDQKADAAINTIWRNDEEGRAILLRISATGHEAAGKVTALVAGDAPAATAAPEAAASGTDVSARAAEANAPQRHAAGRTDSTAGPASTDTGSRGTGLSEPARGDEAGAADRYAPAAGRRDHRADRRGDRLAAPHGAGCPRRGTDEEAGAGRHF
jgi:hypothetical protein